MRGATPQRGEVWLNSLPVFDESQHLNQYGLFTGVVNGVENLVIKITQTNLIIFSNLTSNGHWCFNKEKGTIELSMKPGSNWSVQIKTQAGIVGKEGSIEGIAGVDTVDIKFKLLPAAPTP